MNDSAPRPAPRAEARRALNIQPGFLAGLKGLWMLTWRSQVTWSKLPWALLGLMMLPALVYLTTMSEKRWREIHRFNMGDPGGFVSEYARRAQRARVPIDTELRNQMLVIVQDEFQRAETEVSQQQGTINNATRAAAADLCYDQISERASSFLSERQMDLLREHSQRQQGRQRNPEFVDKLISNRSAVFYRWLIDLFCFIVIPLECVRLSGSLIRDELEAATLPFLTIRPLSRGTLLLAKYFSQMGIILIWMILQTSLIFGAAWARQLPDLLPLFGLFIAVQAAAVFAWSALGLLFGQITKKYMGLALLYGVVVELGIGRIPTNINTLSIMRHIQSLLGHNPSLQSTYEWTAPVQVGGPIGAIFLGGVFFLICASLLFSYREYHHVSEAQK